MGNPPTVFHTDPGLYFIHKFIMYTFKDEFYSDWYNDEKHKVPASEFWNLTASYTPDNADWYVNLWANNLRDKRQITSLLCITSLHPLHSKPIINLGAHRGKQRWNHTYLCWIPTGL